MRAKVRGAKVRANEVVADSLVRDLLVLVDLDYVNSLVDVQHFSKGEVYAEDSLLDLRFNGNEIVEKHCD